MGKAGDWWFAILPFFTKKKSKKTWTLFEPCNQVAGVDDHSTKVLLRAQAQAARLRACSCDQPLDLSEDMKVTPDL